MVLVLAIVFFILVLVIAIYTVKIIPQQQVAVIERLGKYHRQLEAGIRIIIPFLDLVRERHDLRIRQLNVPPQKVITKDNAQVDINTVIFFQVTDPHLATYGIQNHVEGVKNISNATMRQIIGKLELDETLSGRDRISIEIRLALDEATEKWGVRINRVEIVDILPPVEIQEAMNKQMQADRERRAVILQAEAAKQDAILRAQGQKESQILQAEGEKEARIRQAEGLKAAQELEAEGEAKAIELVASAERNRIENLKQAGLDSQVLTYKSFEALEELAKGEANKVFIPTGAIDTLGSIGAMAEMLKASGKNSQP
ncbi:SPFH domain-containing protein [Paenibacillus senegalensis]|uniref:SPFH domain-containing protein n=1 Tax=Paenibacillus senegalensis TaxID=1465766 RepID=UPI0005A93123|nr:SPFH domain-containing protein [Paenibacillus senegalensis]